MGDRRERTKAVRKEGDEGFVDVWGGRGGEGVSFSFFGFLGEGEGGFFWVASFHDDSCEEGEEGSKAWMG